MKSRCFKLLSSLSMIAAFCLQSSSAEAIFASVKSTGMAATCVAYPLDTLVTAYNPAGMADVGDRFDLEAGWVRTRGHTKISGNIIPGVDGKRNGVRTKDSFPANIGINKTLPYDMTIGLVVYNRDYQKTTYKDPLILFGTSAPGLEYVHEVVSPTWTIKICDRWNFGVSANYHLQRLKVNGLQNFDNVLRSEFPGHVTNKGYNYAHGWNYTLGFRGQITDCLSVGVAWSPKTTMSRLKKYEGFLAHKGRLDIPQKVNAGIAYQFLPCLVVAFDVEWLDWKQVKALSNPLLQDGHLELLGSSNGPGFGFRNQWYYRVGFDWAVCENWTVRAGYRHANTPVRRSQTAVNSLLLDCAQDFITFGTTYELNCCHEFSFLFAYGFEHTVKGHNSIPPGVPPAGFGGGEADISEQKWGLGLAWGWKY